MQPSPAGVWIAAAAIEWAAVGGAAVAGPAVTRPAGAGLENIGAEAPAATSAGVENIGAREGGPSAASLEKMPRARVTGTVTIDGRAHAIRGTGYHDHNWGEWVPTDATWNWAQFSSPRLSLEVGDFIGKPAGVVALDLDGTRTVFSPDQYSLVHTRWGWDRVNRLFYPTESLLTADNGALRLEATLWALTTEPLRGELPRPLRDVRGGA